MYELAPIAQSQPAVLKSLRASSALVPLASTSAVLAVDRNRRTSDQCVGNSYAGYDQGVRMCQSHRRECASARHFRHDSHPGGTTRSFRTGEPNRVLAVRYEQFLQSNAMPPC